MTYNKFKKFKKFRYPQKAILEELYCNHKTLLKKFEESLNEGNSIRTLSDNAIIKNGFFGKIFTDFVKRLNF